jgi:hypothetical protein
MWGSQFLLLSALSLLLPSAVSLSSLSCLRPLSRISGAADAASPHRRPPPHCCCCRRRRFRSPAPPPASLTGTAAASAYRCCRRLRPPRGPWGRGSAPTPPLCSSRSPWPPSAGRMHPHRRRHRRLSIAPGRRKGGGNFESRLGAIGHGAELGAPWPMAPSSLPRRRFTFALYLTASRCVILAL